MWTSTPAETLSGRTATALSGRTTTGDAERAASIDDASHLGWRVPSVFRMFRIGFPDVPETAALRSKRDPYSAAKERSGRRALRHSGAVAVGARVRRANRDRRVSGAGDASLLDGDPEVGVLFGVLVRRLVRRLSLV